jgi:hypothetical protein
MHSLYSMTVVIAVAALGGAVPACSDSEGAASGLTDAGEDAQATERPERSTLVLGDGTVGIGFDDLQYSTALDRLIVPAGRAGYVALVEPRSEKVTRLGSFSTTDTYTTGHDFGTTSAIEAEGLVYAIDRTAMELQQLDPESGDKIGAVALGGAPDYLRYVVATREIWVTEPQASRFEIFALSHGDPPELQANGNMAFSGGPESMVADAAGAIAYTNTFVGQTARIDVASRTETARWSNGCKISLGLALDEANERIFVGCAEGKAVALDTTTGATLSTLNATGGVDIIAYSSDLSHLYLNGSTNGELTVAGVGADGTLTQLAAVPTAPSTDSSCVASDPYGNIWVCDANSGQLLRITDRF